MGPHLNTRSESPLPDSSAKASSGSRSARPLRSATLVGSLTVSPFTEAAISTFRRKSDPRGSVGLVTDPQVQILNERGEECEPAELDEEGKITNYAAAVGEICRVAEDSALFQGYFDNPDANAFQVPGRRLPFW